MPKLCLYLSQAKDATSEQGEEGEKRKRETFICENEGRDGESCSGCNAV